MSNNQSDSGLSAMLPRPAEEGYPVTARQFNALLFALRGIRDQATRIYDQLEQAGAVRDARPCVHMPPQSTGPIEGRVSLFKQEDHSRFSEEAGQLENVMGKLSRAAQGRLGLPRQVVQADGGGFVKQEPGEHGRLRQVVPGQHADGGGFIKQEPVDAVEPAHQVGIKQEPTDAIVPVQAGGGFIKQEPQEASQAGPQHVPPRGSNHMAPAGGLVAKQEPAGGAPAPVPQPVKMEMPGEPERPLPLPSVIPVVVARPFIPGPQHVPPYSGGQVQHLPPQGGFGQAQHLPPQGAAQHLPPQGGFGQAQHLPPQGGFGQAQHLPPQGAAQHLPPQGAAQHLLPQNLPPQGGFGQAEMIPALVVSQNGQPKKARTNVMFNPEQKKYLETQLKKVRLPEIEEMVAQLNRKVKGTSGRIITAEKLIEAIKRRR